MFLSYLELPCLATDKNGTGVTGEVSWRKWDANLTLVDGKNLDRMKRKQLHIRWEESEPLNESEKGMYMGSDNEITGGY